MMKNSFLLLSLMAAALGLIAKPGPGDEQSNVQKAISMFFSGIAELDTLKMNYYTTPDLLVLEDGAVWNMDSLTRKILPLKAKVYKRINHFDFIRTEVNGNRAFVAYYNAAEISVDDQKRNVQWLESAMLVYERNQWKIKLLHSTRLKTKLQ